MVADRTYAEKISSTMKSRPELDRMIEQLRDGGGQPPAVVYFNATQTDQQVQAVA
jgi:DNA invertase Pin-like site-specific DNA recombinase